MNLSQYDLIISSSAWFVTRGFKKKKEGAREVCYCHTPPRYLYGFETSKDWKKNWLVRAYATLVNPFMRVYDFRAAQRVDQFVTNSENTKSRIAKFYRQDARVVYPPVGSDKDYKVRNFVKDDGYYLMVNRLVRMKRIDVAVEVFGKLEGDKLKIVGTGPDEKRLKGLAEGKDNIEFLGYVDDEKLSELYAKCRAVIYLAIDEDFGITPVEAMQSGKPVIGVNSGGVKESVVDPSTGSGQVATGILMKNGGVNELVGEIKDFGKKKFDKKEILNQAEKFSKKRFIKEFGKLVELEYGKKRA